MRSLTRQPGLTATALVVLGTAIGLNTSLFTVFAGLAFRPWAGITDASRVVTVWAANPLGRSGLVGLSFPEYRFLAAEAKSFSGLVAIRPHAVRLESDGVGRSTGAYLVTANYFDVLGVRMARGRGFVRDEDRRASPQAVAVLSHDVWESRFGGDVDVVGRPIRINDVPFTVIGIASPEFTGPEPGPGRLWLPMSVMPLLRPHDTFAARMLDRPEDCCVHLAGRLRPGTMRDQAGAELQLLSRRFRASVGQEDRPIIIGGTAFLSGRRAAGEALAIFGVLFVGMILVLLIACANVGNLLLVRGAARVGEVGVRLSLGATRGRIVRQLLTEGFVLALCASLAGVMLSMWLPPLVLRTMVGSGRPFDIDPDTLVLGYAVCLAIVSCLVCALAPALHATQCDITSALNGTLLLRSRFPLRSVLLAVQVAVTVVLLTSAALLFRGVAQARVIDPGFAVENVAIATLELPEQVYDEPRRRAFVADLAAQLRQAPVDSFGFVSNEPLGNSSSMTSLRLPSEGDDQARPIEYLEVSPGYFNVLRIPIVAGRNFGEADIGRRVAIVNESMAHQYWPGQNPVGKSFFGGGREPLEIIGIARDAYTEGLNRIEPMFFRLGGDMPKLLFRSANPSSADAITLVVNRLDPRVRVDITAMSDRLDRWLESLTFGPMAASALGIFALGLASTGMFGVFAYAVRQRTKELGIRMALGARPRELVRLVLAGSSRAVLAGLAVGSVGAVAAARLLRSSLYGVSALDPIAYGGAAVVLALAAVVASYVPARRAANIDPISALRYE